MARLPAFEEFFADHPELFDHSAGRLLTVAVANEQALVDGRVELPLAPLEVRELAADQWPPPVVSLEANQTPFEPQGARGTCYAFAAVAAMEAAYRRQFGVELDLSEQYAFHLNKVTELVGNYLTVTRAENNSSLWGFQGSSDLVDRLARAAIPDEASCPYLDDAPMQQLLGLMPALGTLSEATATQEEVDSFEFDDRHVPLSARWQARYRVKSFGALPANPSTGDIERVVAAGHEVVVDIPGHCVVIVGYDRNLKQFTIKDSANPIGFQTLAYNSPMLPIFGGRYITEVHPPDAAPQLDAMWLGRWQMEHDGWRGELVIRRTTDFHFPPGQLTKLGNYYAGGQRFDVNGEVVEGGRAMHFWIADTTNKVAPGSTRGQEFFVWLFGRDPVSAAGFTTWNGSRFGVTLSRATLPTQSSDSFEIFRWVGHWEVNHDGWRGVLLLQSFQPTRGRYTAGDGRVFQAEGPNSFHGLDLDVWGLQRFQLYLHTRNPDMASGVTIANGQTFGVQLRRIIPPVVDPATLPEPAVPGVVGLSHQDGFATLRDAGYGVQTHWEWSSGQDLDFVSGQEPAGGAPDLPPITVHIWVRTLPPEPIPDPIPEPIPEFPDDTVIIEPPIQ